MKRILLMVLRNIVFVPYWWIKLCWYAAHTDDYPEEKKYAFLRQVDERAIEGGNIHIDVHGAENIPKEKGFMFFPNHQGLFDVLAIIRACPVPFSVVAKKEVGEIPFLKQVFACMKAFITFCAPCTLVLMHSSGLYSAVSTCLMAAAWIIDRKSVV